MNQYLKFFQKFRSCGTCYAFGALIAIQAIVYKYIMVNGIASEQDYPYTGVNGICKYKSAMASVAISDYMNHLRLSTADTKKVLNVIGPVSIGINASDDLFTLYKSGIYRNRLLDPTAMDHSVLLVGYNHDAITPYWIIKNR